jgi:hypothetical protein
MVSCEHNAAQTLQKRILWSLESIFKCLPNQLGIYLFLAKQENLCSNSLTSNLANFNNLTNLPPPRAYLRAERKRASLAHPASRAYLRGALRFLAGLFVRLAGLFVFYQVQIANSWRGYIFSLVIYLSKLPNHDICQVNFGKLLEMLFTNSEQCCLHVDFSNTFSNYDRRINRTFWFIIVGSFVKSCHRYLLLQFAPEIDLSDVLLLH